MATVETPMLAADDALLSFLLGGRSLAALAGASLVVEHRRGALLAASAAFGRPVAPF